MNRKVMSGEVVKEDCSRGQHLKRLTQERQALQRSRSTLQAGGRARAKAWDRDELVLPDARGQEAVMRWGKARAESVRW